MIKDSKFPEVAIVYIILLYYNSIFNLKLIFSFFEWMEVIIVNDNFFVIVIIVTKIYVRIIYNNSIQPVTGWYLLVTA